MVEQEGIRINKYLSEAGVCSRRAADRAIDAGYVQINGRNAEKGDRVLPGDEVIFCGQKTVREQERVLIAFHKPRGIVCTADESEPDNIISYIHYPSRIFTIGRLDKESEGLILLTNQGDLFNKIMRAGNYHEKEYIVTVNRKIDDAFVSGMSSGVYLPGLDVTTRPCSVKAIGPQTFSIVLTQGYNRQIRRMCREFGCHVERLIRVRIMNIHLGNLPVGTYRDVTQEEWTELLRLTADSSSAPIDYGAEKLVPVDRKPEEQK